MKMFVWNSRNLSRFNNFYGESMLCIVAESLSDAVNIIKEKDFFLWEIIIDKMSFQPSTTVGVYPARYKDMVKLESFFIEAKRYHELFVKDGYFIESKNKEYIEWSANLKEQADEWFMNNIMDENGLSPYMNMPIEVDLTQPQYFISKASD